MLDAERRDQLGRRAFGWVRDSRTRLAQHPDVTHVVKAMGEIGLAAEMVAIAARRRGDSTLAVEAQALLDACWDGLERGALVERVIVQTRQPMFGAVYPSFWRANLRSEPFEAALVRLARAFPVPAGLSFGLAVALHEVGLAPAAAVERTYPACTLARELAAATATEPLMYGVVHDIMYVTDLGRSPERLSARAAAYVAEAFPLWRQRCVASGNLDLVAELVVGEHHANLPCDPTAWDVLLAGQDADGRVAFFANQPASDASYHSTLATMMAWASCAH